MTDFKLNFMHLCDDASFSQEGKLTLTGIFDVVNVLSIPGSLLKAMLVFNISILNKDTNKVTLDIQLINKKNGEVVLSIPSLTADIPKEVAVQNSGERKMGLVVQLANITFSNEGIYEITLKANGSKVGNYDFTVNKIKEKEAAN